MACKFFTAATALALTSLAMASAITCGALANANFPATALPVMRPIPGVACDSLR